MRTPARMAMHGLAHPVTSVAEVSCGYAAHRPEMAYPRNCPGLVDGNVTDPRLRHARVRGTVVSW